MPGQCCPAAVHCTQPVCAACLAPAPSPGHCRICQQASGSARSSRSYQGLQQANTQQRGENDECEKQIILNACNVETLDDYFGVLRWGNALWKSRVTQSVYKQQTNVQCHMMYLVKAATRRGKPVQAGRSSKDWLLHEKRMSMRRQAVHSLPQDVKTIEQPSTDTHKLLENSIKWEEDLAKGFKIFAALCVLWMKSKNNQYLGSLVLPADWLDTWKYFWNLNYLDLYCFLVTALLVCGILFQTDHYLDISRHHFFMNMPKLEWLQWLHCHCLSRKQWVISGNK